MSITTSSGKIIVEFEIGSVSGTKAIGAYLLKINIKYSMPTHENDVYFRNTIAKIYVGKDADFLGLAFPEQPKTFKPNGNPQKGGLLYEMLVSKDTLEQIEVIRKGEDLQLKVVISGEYSDGLNQLCDNETVTYSVNQREWINTLKLMNFKGGLVFELPMAISPTQEVKTALVSVEKAKDHFYYGNYDDVVAKCRIALESIVTGWGGTAELTNQIKKNRKEMTKEQRLYNTINQIIHLTHLSHHPDEKDEYIYFSRSEAVFVLGSTISAVSSYAENKI